VASGGGKQLNAEAWAGTAESPPHADAGRGGSPWLVCAGGARRPCGLSPPPHWQAGDRVNQRRSATRRRLCW
jgi:hypothetical protein